MKHLNKIIIGGIILLIILFGIYYFFEKEDNLLGEKTCGNLLSLKDIQSICNLKENYILQKNSTYVNKFDDPDFNRLNEYETFWSLYPEFVENCDISFKGENVSGIYLTVWGFSDKSQALSNYNFSISRYADINPKREIEKVNSLGDVAQYSKGGFTNLDSSGNWTIVGSDQDIFLVKDGKHISIQEIKTPFGTPFICSKEQIIQLSKLIESKVVK